MECKKSIDEIRKISRDQLLEKVKNAEKEICMIGTIAFNFPWAELIDNLGEKFRSTDFSIRILRESETTIAQYALLTLSQEDNSEYGNMSRGNLVGIREKVIRDLKNTLKEVTDGKNIEPPEDIFATELGNLFYTEKRKYMLKSYEINGCLDDFYNYMKSCVKIEIEKKKEDFFGNPQFIKKVSEFISTNAELVSRYAKKVEELLEEVTTKVLKYIEETKYLTKMDEEKDNAEIEVRANKKGQSSICIKFSLNSEDIVIEETMEFNVEQWFDRFMLDSSREEENYRLKADKAQAIKRATELRKQRLEEYQRNSETKQRLFVKNCYMPIPVPMIKIDDELFITMALTRFDSIDKFQYVGKIKFDEKTGSYKAEEGEMKYRSLWLDDFVNYYQEYFANPNGAQKYSTEETAKGNRKEVIDIFDENRNRIGTGPRDAFLANMAIVKSVVWALIFDRKGRILIHQRAKNAKDNQGLWDKSVGGHVSTEDLDTIEAIKREITEELFTIENEGQSGHDSIQWMITNKNKIIYLGDWKTTRFPDLGALNLSPDEYYNFSLNYPDINKRDFRREIVITERLLPNGETVKAKCFVDPYLCIVSEDFDISKLYNSRFALLTPNELKHCVIKKRIKLNANREYDSKNGVEEEFRPTSDLAYLVEAGIWDDVVTEFARRVKETFEK